MGERQEDWTASGLSYNRRDSPGKKEASDIYFFSIRIFFYFGGGGERRVDNNRGRTSGLRDCFRLRFWTSAVFTSEFVLSTLFVEGRSSAPPPVSYLPSFTIPLLPRLSEPRNNCAAMNNFKVRMRSLKTKITLCLLNDLNWHLFLL